MIVEAKPKPQTTFAAHASLCTYSTCPVHKNETGEEFRRNVIQTARWSEEAGCSGLLIYTDNRVIDPWVLAQLVLQNTRTISPLVALQPVFMHPFAVAKQVAALSFLYNRRVDMNLVAGGFKTELDALHDPTPHDQRYARLIEYTTIIQQLLERSCEGKAATFHGKFYQVDRLKLVPAMRPEFLPQLTISGSSEAARDAARELGAVAVCYPRSASVCATELPAVPRSGIRVGIIARSDAHTAWDVAHERFPADPKGQLTHQLAMKLSDSVWHDQLSQAARNDGKPGSPYWLFPFENYATFCPYLVGDYETVAGELRRYFDCGYRSLILDIPPDREELDHAAHAVSIAMSGLQ